MKFFSNDAKDNTEEQAHDDRDIDNPDHVRSEPVAVPQQRAGSPWSDAPGTADGPDLPLGDQGPHDQGPHDHGPHAHDRRDDLRPDDSELRTPGDEPIRSEVDTTTPPHADPVDVPLDDENDRVDNHDFGDRAVPATAGATAYGPDDTVPVPPEQRVDADAPLRDDGDFDSPRAVEPATGRPLDADADTADNPVSTDVDDRFAAVPIEATADTTPTDTTAADTTPADTTPAPVATADQTPGSVESPKLDRLFPDGDSFADRFRDVQLRFVDSPKEATAEAAALVGEAVDQLTSSLRAQKDSLSGNSDDTERLRVELRGYRDMLNRLTSL
jgi:hypothetical protein